MLGGYHVKEISTDGFTLSREYPADVYPATSGWGGGYHDYLAGQGFGTVKGGSFAIDTSSTDQSITGVGFTPTAVLFLGSAHDYSTGNGVGVDHVHLSFGAATSTDNSSGFAGGQYGWSCYVAHDLQEGISGHVRTDAGCIIRAFSASTSGTVRKQAEYSLKSFDTDGFTIEDQLLDGADGRINYLAFSGLGIEVGGCTGAAQGSTSADSDFTYTTVHGVMGHFTYSTMDPSDTGADFWGGPDAHPNLGFATSSGDQCSRGGTFRTGPTGTPGHIYTYMPYLLSVGEPSTGARTYLGSVEAFEDNEVGIYGDCDNISDSFQESYFITFMQALSQEQVVGTLTFSGTLWENLWTSYLASGTLTISGAISDFKLSLSRGISGLLQFAGSLTPKAIWKRFFDGVVSFTGGLTDYPTVFYDMVVTGILNLSGRFPNILQTFKAILATIRMRIGSASLEQPVKGQIGMGYVNSTDPDLGEYANRVLNADVEIDVN
jgi:hypothetical protein